MLGRDIARQTNEAKTTKRREHFFFKVFLRPQLLCAICFERGRKIVTTDFVRHKNRTLNCHVVAVHTQSARARREKNKETAMPVHDM